MEDRERDEQETQAAAAEAAAIGGDAGEDFENRVDPADRAVIEGGGGESEGFEEAERLLEEHATHGDQHAARRVIEDAGEPENEGPGAPAGEADSAYSSEQQSSDH